MLISHFLRVRDTLMLLKDNKNTHTHTTHTLHCSIQQNKTALFLLCKVVKPALWQCTPHLTDHCRLQLKSALQLCHLHCVPLLAQTVGLYCCGLNYSRYFVCVVSWSRYVLTKTPQQGWKWQKWNHCVHNRGMWGVEGHDNSIHPYRPVWPLSTHSLFRETLIPWLKVKAMLLNYCW